MPDDAPLDLAPPDPSSLDLDELVARLTDRQWQLATAESVTAGQVASRLAAAPRASEWLLGGLVAWHPRVKRDLLAVPPGPVVNAATAAAMARGAAELLGAHVALSTTGVGGPDGEEGWQAGTVFVGLLVEDRLSTHELHLDGDPEQVCTGAADHALALLLERLRAT